MNDALTTIREAVPADIPRLLELVQELADFERMPSAVEATADHFHRALFPDDNVSARGHALVAEVLTPQGPQVVGMAVWYVTFSTWLGRHGLWLEDLYVSPTQRGAGLGQALLSRLAQIAAQRDYGRVEWRVLGWNEHAIGFYRSLGAVAQDEWVEYRVDGAALQALAGNDRQDAVPVEDRRRAACDAGLRAAATAVHHDRHEG